MTSDHDPARKSLESERAELADQLDACVTKSGGIDLRDPELLRRAASALRLAAPDQKPFGWHYEIASPVGRRGFRVWRWHMTRVNPDVPDCEIRNLTPLYEGISPPPAAGWDEAIEAACKICSAVADETHNMSRMAAAEEICEQIEALRTTPAATKSANAGVIDACWRTELDEIVSRLGAAITQSIASDDQIIMDHVKAAHDIAKVVRRQA